MKSDRYDVIKLAELIDSYINHPKSGAGARLSNQVIYGHELASALDNLEFEADEEGEMYREIKTDFGEFLEKYKCEDFYDLIQKYEEMLEEAKGCPSDLISGLENLIKDKEGAFVEEIKKLIKETKKINPPSKH